MKSIILKNVSKSYNGQLILDNLSLTIPSGKFFALLGPSGCGKTTILRLIAGFDHVDSGKIFLGDEEITNVPIYKRHVNTVFQNYALFPHLNVFDNVAFSLKVRHVNRKEIEQQVIKVLKLVRLEGHIYKSIDQLSGGQQQRVALARSMINKPDVLLLDEPLAALDVKLRERMLIELMDLQETLETTFVYVTHDQHEALTVAEQMAIMNQDGMIEQIDTPRKIYEKPISTYVARFVGNTTIIPGTLHIAQGKTVVDVPKIGIFDVSQSKYSGVLHNDSSIYMNIRPEKIELSKSKNNNTSRHEVKGIVESIAYHGSSTLYYMKVHEKLRIIVFHQNYQHTIHQLADYDEEVYLSWQPQNVVLLGQ